MDNIIIVKVNEEDVGLRVDVFLCKAVPSLSRSKIQKLILQSNVILNGDNSNIARSYTVKLSDEFKIINKEEVSTLIAKEIPIDVLWEDEHLLFINKPAGLVVHPGAGNFEDTLVNALLFRYKENLSTINGEFRAGIVHRLDKDTSGVLVVAKNDEVHAKLSKQFEEHSVVRNYRAMIWGRPTNNSGKIETFIARDEHNRQKMSVSTTKKGKQAITNYKVIDTYNDVISLVDLKLQTGRTHQIRVHMAHIKHSVIADSVYSKNNNRYINQLPDDIAYSIQNLNRQALHAYRLGFIHPMTNQYVEVVQDEPEDLMNIYSKLFDYFLE